jgi:hypothetical protein
VGPVYERLGYKRMILDYHFSAFLPETLVDADADQIVASMARAGVESLVLFPKDHWGYIYSKGRVGPHHPSVPGDLFGEVLEKLRPHGIRVMAYHSVHRDEYAARAFPEWTMRLADGSIRHRRYYTEGATHGSWTLVCPNGPYRAYSYAQLEELIAEYDFPSLWLDFIPFTSDGCYCKYCRKLWQAEHGSPLPATLSPTDRVRWQHFWMKSLREYLAGVRQLIVRSGKDIVMTHNYGFPYDHDDYVVTETESAGKDYFRPSRLAKFWRAYAMGREVEAVSYRFNQPWDFTIKSRHQLRWEVATNLGHNCAMCFVDQPDIRGTMDPKVYEALADAFAVVDELAPHVRGSVPYAEVALLASEWSATLTPDSEDDFGGALRMLTEAHLPFDVLADTAVATTDLSRFKAIVVANTVHMAPEATEALRRYVAAGGLLLFTYRSATLDLEARPATQPSFGFVEVVSECPYNVSFLKPTFEVGDTRMRVREIVWFRPQAGAEPRATYTPPALEVTAEQWVSHNVMPGADGVEPAAVVGAFGQGHYIYIGARIFTEYLRQDLPSIRAFVLSLLREHVRPRVWVEAPAAVEAIYQQRGDDLIVTLVNGITNKPSAHGHRFVGERGHIGLNEVVPIAGVRVRVADARLAGAADRLGRTLETRQDDDAATIELPRLDLYELVRFQIVGSAAAPERATAGGRTT